MLFVDAAAGRAGALSFDLSFFVPSLPSSSLLIGRFLADEMAAFMSKLAKSSSSLSNSSNSLIAVIANAKVDGRGLRFELQRSDDDNDDAMKAIEEG